MSAKFFWASENCLLKCCLHDRRRLKTKHCVHVQVCEHLQRIGKVCGVWVVPIVGGISPIKQERLLKKLPEVNSSLFPFGGMPIYQMCICEMV